MTIPLCQASPSCWTHVDRGLDWSPLSERRISCSVPAPVTSSRRLYTVRRQDSTQVVSWLRARH
jgi:hypothetical protein